GTECGGPAEDFPLLPERSNLGGEGTVTMAQSVEHVGKDGAGQSVPVRCVTRQQVRHEEVLTRFVGMTTLILPNFLPRVGISDPAAARETRDNLSLFPEFGNFLAPLGVETGEEETRSARPGTHQGLDNHK